MNSTSKQMAQVDQPSNKEKRPLWDARKIGDEIQIERECLRCDIKFIATNKIKRICNQCSRYNQHHVIDCYKVCK